AETRLVAHSAELVDPGALVGGGGAVQPLDLDGAEVGAGRAEHRLDRGVHRSSGGRRGELGGSPLAETEQVVRATGLGAGADCRPLPAAERLALHDRAGDSAVDVEVAGLDAVEPGGDLVGIERVDA